METAIADEMATFKEEWEAVLDDLETKSAHLLVWFYLSFSVDTFVNNIFFSLCVFFNFYHYQYLKIGIICILLLMILIWVFLFISF